MSIYKKSNIITKICIASVVTVVLVMAGATVVEKYKGSGYVAADIYGSWWFVLLWAVAAISGAIVMFRHKVYRHSVTFLLHVSFLVILIGAGITHFSAQQGIIHLREGEAATDYMMVAGEEPRNLPFSVALDDFSLITYPGTQAPMDYRSVLLIDNDTVTVEMNSIGKYCGYRFYASGYDYDLGGSILRVCHDRIGIAVTYIGYALLMLSMVAFFFVRKSGFRRLVSGGTVFAVILFVPHTIKAESEIPPVLPEGLAAQLGKLYVSYNERICPLSTLAKDVTIKLYGKDSYKGLTSEQVISGWLFYADAWIDEPVAKIKKRELRDLLGIDGKYASMNDFYECREPLMRGDMKFSADFEKFAILQMLCNGSLMKIFPYDNIQSVSWASPNDMIPDNVDAGQRMFVKNVLNYAGEMTVAGDYAGLSALLDKIRDYQKKSGGDSLPSDSKFSAELLYEKIGISKHLSMIAVLAGIILYIYACRRMATGHRWRGGIVVLAYVATGFIYIVLSGMIGLRWYIAGHVPLSNGFETMQCMAWCALAAAMVMQRKFSLSLPFGLLVCGMALMVAMIGEKNPVVTPLMPVLASPLLSVHVFTVMVAYALLAFMMLNGITGLVFGVCGRIRQSARMADVSLILAYPAVFCLAAGIFIGAIWANNSWGRYWGWDPKEVWALITMMVYSLAVHWQTAGLRKNPMRVHVFTIVAFLCVVITYFGVNFFLGGMHSYA